MKKRKKKRERGIFVGLLLDYEAMLMTGGEEEEATFTPPKLIRLVVTDAST